MVGEMVVGGACGGTWGAPGGDFEVGMVQAQAPSLRSSTPGISTGTPRPWKLCPPLAPLPCVSVFPGREGRPLRASAPPGDLAEGR